MNRENMLDQLLHTGSYNGNISENRWALHHDVYNGAKNDIKGSYRYQYDKLNRLTKADFSGIYIQTTPPNGETPAEEPCIGGFTTSYSYDLNGNITSLMRKGANSLDQEVTIVDSLQYRYTGNCLKAVVDNSGVGSEHEVDNFDDLADYDVEYTWDANGNMTMDANKAITAIEYNALNLPRRVTFADGHITEYLYDAAGEKRQTKYLVDNRTVFAAMALGETESDEVMEASDSTAIETLLTRDYCGDYIYSDGSLERIMTINGYYSGSSYAYFVRDYQGNVVKLNFGSMSANWSQYYPYGGLFPDYTVNRYLYSGKELDKINGLYLYDFHARHYDPMLARFTTIDPLCEKYYPISPYAYCAGNPIRYIDPTGMQISIGTILYKINSAYDGDDTFIAEIWQSLDALSRNGGLKLITDLIESSTNYNYLPTSEANGYTQQIDENTVNINISTAHGMEKNGLFSTVAHESMHAAQYENGQGGASIFNEVEAYTFENYISVNSVCNSNNPEDWIFSNATSMNTGNTNSKVYSTAIQDLTGGFSVESMHQAIISFKKGAGANNTGIYNKNPLLPKFSYQLKSMLKKYLIWDD